MRKLTTAILAMSTATALGLGSTALATLCNSALLPTADAQIPAGVDLQSAIGGPISVPAGQTTTVDLGVPVSANYSGGGWSVYSSGTSVTVTAPASGSASVPVSAGGQSATITLIADQGAEVPGAAGGSGSGGNGSGGGTGGGNGDGGGTGGGNGDGGAGSNGDSSNGGAQPGNPDGANNWTNAEQLRFDSTIQGNTITAKLGLIEAANLANRFSNLDQPGMKLRYLDANGKEIMGIKRDIDKGSRTLTLTYPEGQTPDNPFVLEVSKDGEPLVIATLTDKNQPVTTPTNPASSPIQEETEVKTVWWKHPGVLAVAGVLGLVLIVGLLASLGRRK